MKENYWRPVDERPEIEKEYIVLYKHSGDVGQLHFFEGSWVNGNIIVNSMITHWIDFPLEILNKGK